MRRVWFGFLCSLLVGISFGSNGQNLLLEVKSGYGIAHTNRLDYKFSGFVPLHMSLGGGLKNLQIGVDVMMNPLEVGHIFYDEFTEERRFIEKTKQRVYGGFLRLNTAAEPEDNAGFIAKFGMGYVDATREVVVLESDQTYSKKKFEPTFLVNGELGVSIPFVSMGHIYFGYGFHYNKMTLKEHGIVLDDYKQFRHLILLGVNLSVDFTN